MKQQRAEKINKTLQDELDKSNKGAEGQTKQIKTLREALEERQHELDDKLDVIDTIRAEFEQQRLELISLHEKEYNELKDKMEQKLAEEHMRMEALKSENKAQTRSSADESAKLVKEMGQMLKEAIEKSTKK